MTDELRILTGHGSIDLLNPVPGDVNMMDVVTNLSRIRRWNGAIDFTVMQHSLLVEAILYAKGCNQATCLAGLLDDGPEYATNDICGPLLDRLWLSGMYMHHVQAEIRAAIFNKIGLDVDTVIDTVDETAIRAADMEARTAEVHWLLPESALRTELMAKYPEPDSETRQAFVKVQGANLDTLVGMLKYYGVSVNL